MNKIMPESKRRWTLAAALIAALAACSQKQNGPETLDHRNQQQVMQYLDQNQPTVRSEGKTLTFGEMVESALESRVVFVGERHDRYDHHLNQLALLRALHQRYPDLSIGVEWFQQPFQAELDAYLAGRLNDTQLLSRSQYLDRWGYDFRMMRPIFEFAREHRIPLVALNADVEITRQVGSQGLDSLSAEQRAQLPEIITPPPDEEREALKEIFSHHPNVSAENFDNFVTVQRIWDLTMAEAIVEHLKDYPQRKMVVFAGDGHVSRGRAIPQAVAHLQPEWNTTVVQSWIETPDDYSGADFIIVTRPSQLPPIGKLGVWLENGNGGALIKQVVEDSAASKAGIEDGDVITALDGQTTPDSASLKILLSRHGPGENVELTLLRNGTPQILKVTLN